MDERKVTATQLLLSLQPTKRLIQADGQFRIYTHFTLAKKRRLIKEMAQKNKTANMFLTGFGYHSQKKKNKLIFQDDKFK